MALPSLKIIFIFRGYFQNHSKHILQNKPKKASRVFLFFLIIFCLARLFPKNNLKIFLGKGGTQEGICHFFWFRSAFGNPFVTFLDGFGHFFAYPLLPPPPLWQGHCPCFGVLEGGCLGRGVFVFFFALETTGTTEATKPREEHFQTTPFLIVNFEEPRKAPKPRKPRDETFWKQPLIKTTPFQRSDCLLSAHARKSTK